MDNKLKTVDAETLLSTPMSKTMFIVDGLISQGVNVISGASKIGKSWLMLWLGRSGSPKSPLDFLGRGGTAERVSFAACGETKDTELVTTKRADCFTPVGAKQCIRLRCLRHLSEQCVFTPGRAGAQKHSLGRALKPRKKKL